MEKEKKKETGKEYYVLTDPSPVKKPGQEEFKPGEPQEVPELFKEEYDKDPNFSIVKSPDKLKLEQMAPLRKKKFEEVTAARDKWRVDRKAGKHKIANAPKEAPTKGGDTI